MNVDEGFYTQNVRALIVDDLTSNLFVAECVLRKYGIEVVTAISGEESIKKVQAEDFDIVFMDYMMPGMNGVDAVKAIRALGGRYEAIPIVAFSSVDDKRVEGEVMKAGMNAFVSKPFVTERLCDVLMEFLPAGKIVFK